MKNENVFRIALDDGKYEVVLPENYQLYALRNGEPWRDLTGDNLVYLLASEVHELREKILELHTAVIDLKACLRTCKNSSTGALEQYKDL